MLSLLRANDFDRKEVQLLYSIFYKIDTGCPGLL